MEPPEVARAIDAAISIATALGLPADDATVLHNSNKLALRLLPCDVFARVSLAERPHARVEVQLAQQLANTQSPVATLDPRVEPRGYQHDGFEVTLWTYYAPATAPATPDISPAAYASALQRLHTGMRQIDLPAPHFTVPHFTDRIAEAQHIVSSTEFSPALSDTDRELLASTLQRLRQTILDRRPAEQLLHGEPHPDNVLNTAHGPLFIDLETCCYGPVEFDLAHVPRPVSDHYPEIDQALLQDCRHLVLAMVAAWRWEPGDQFPHGIPFGRAFLDILRAGPPWPTLDEVHPRLDVP